jgi:hypothetical protein
MTNLKPSEKVSEWYETKLGRMIMDKTDMGGDIHCGTAYKIFLAYQEELIGKLKSKILEKPDSCESNIKYNDGLQIAIEIIKESHV